VGCSSGAFLYHLNKCHPNDYEICGTDVSGPPLDCAEKMGVPVIRGDFLAHSFAKSYDAVTFWAVMEHLFEPQLFLKKAASVLKPGGLCFILVPNMRSLAVRLLGAKYRYIYPEHLNYFTRETLEKFMRREFSLQGFKSTHFNPLVIIKDFRGSGRDIPRAERAQLLKRTNAYKKSPWMLPARMGYGAMETILGSLFMADNLALIGQKS
jgi:2-polyprenyl-3-methyl-5-hydroxy-6-metoxy-1,4-benzoquinol methylase